MAVIPFTLTISLCLVFTFVVFFSVEYVDGAGRDSLLPLRKTTSCMVTNPSGNPGPKPAHGNRCACKDGSSPLCAGCLDRSARD